VSAFSEDRTNEVFAQWLVRERLRVGISQERLARLVTSAGFPATQQYLTKVETGQRGHIPLGFAVAVTAAFNATPDVALGLAPDNPEERGLMRCSQCNGNPPAGFTCNTCGGAS
jgi:hypothetical protein